MAMLPLVVLLVFSKATPESADQAPAFLDIGPCHVIASTIKRRLLKKIRIRNRKKAPTLAIGYALYSPSDTSTQSHLPKGRTRSPQIAKAISMWRIQASEVWSELHPLAALVGVHRGVGARDEIGFAFAVARIHSNPGRDANRNG